MRTFVVIRSLLFSVMLMALSAASFAQIGISVSFGPPALPVYEQPICPGDGFIWTPGYWAWDGNDYYWVPGTWVEAPEVGFLWTPGYWGWGGSVESGVGHTKRTPLKEMRFESLEEAQAYLDRWEERWADTRIHGTTKRQVAAMFVEEKPHLQASQPLLEELRFLHADAST